MFKALPDHMKRKGKSTNVQSHLSEKASDNNLVSQPRVINVMQNAKLPVFPPGWGGRRVSKSPSLLKMNASNERTKVCCLRSVLSKQFSISVIPRSPIVTRLFWMTSRGGLGVPGSEARPKDDVIELKPAVAFFPSSRPRSQITSTLPALMEMNGLRQGKDTAERED